MLANKPHLQLIGPQNIADNHVICPVVSQGGRTFRQFTAVSNDDLVSVQQAGELHRNLFPALGWPLNPCSLSHIVGHGDAEATEQLNPFGQGVDKIRMLTEMFVEQQVKLVKSRASDLPM